MYDYYTAQYKPTVGVDFHSKLLNIDGVDFNISFWDIVGADKAGSVAKVKLNRIYYLHLLCQRISNLFFYFLVITTIELNFFLAIVEEKELRSFSSSECFITC